MGMYDTYEGVQLKAGPCSMNNYEMGDRVELHDGLYIGYEGVIVVGDGKLRGVYKTMTDKWGKKMNLYKVLNLSSPLVAVAEKIMKKYQKKKK